MAGVKGKLELQLVSVCILYLLVLLGTTHGASVIASAPGANNNGTTVSSDSEVPYDPSGTNGTTGTTGDFTKETTAGGHNDERYPIVVTDFERVENPFIISLWIFCACLGKIGELELLSLLFSPLIICLCSDIILFDFYFYLEDMFLP